VAIHPVHGYAIPPPQDVKVSRRNARERNRVKTVNDGFEKLKRSIPAAAAVKKLSKVSILSHAVEYIQALQLMLDENPATTAANSSHNITSCHSPHQPTALPHPQGGVAVSPAYPPPLTPKSPNTCYYPVQAQPSYTCTIPSYRSAQQSLHFKILCLVFQMNWSKFFM
jgi:achaete-scute complex protein